MKYKAGDYVIFRLYYKHPDVRGYVQRETLGLIHGIESTMRDNYRMTVKGIPGTTWATDGSIIRLANALEVLTYEACSG